MKAKNCNLMSQSSEKNKRIAKNTLLLYFRMLLVMVLTLYMSRIVLRILGVSDFGVYNVVAGVITMLGFITGPLAGASSRYITVALGEGNFARLRQVFTTTVWVQFFLSAFVIILGETVGLCFVFNKLVIPEERVTAAFWIYQFSIITSVLSFLSVPYNALIIAHEKMSAFAYISILEVSCKFLAVNILQYIDGDSLIAYGLMLLFIQLLVRLIYMIYCKKKFSESRMVGRYDRELLREVFSYSGWCSLGYLAVVGYTQGVNVLLNIFFGPVVNAARGIAVQVQAAISQMCNNFQTAINPQITKSYASKDYCYMHSLVAASSKFSFLVMLIFAIPVIINIPYILKIWLGYVPEHTVNFVRLTLAVALLESLKNPILTAIHATGRIKKFQIIEGCVLLLIVPISYILLACFHLVPEVVFIVYFVIELITQIVRVMLVLPVIQMNLSFYVRRVLFPLVKVLVFVPVIFFFYETSHSFIELLWSSVQIVGILSAFVYIFALCKTEKIYIHNKIKKKNKKI